MWKDKSGKEVSGKEFMSRWKKGIQGVTPLQQVDVQIRSTWIMIVGIMAGIVVTAVAIKTVWWLLIILIGALGNTSIQQLGLWQKKLLLQKFKTPMVLEGGNKDV